MASLFTIFHYDGLLTQNVRSLGTRLYCVFDKFLTIHSIGPFSGMSRNRTITISCRGSFYTSCCSSTRYRVPEPVVGSRSTAVHSVFWTRAEIVFPTRNVHRCCADVRQTYGHRQRGYCVLTERSVYLCGRKKKSLDMARYSKMFPPNAFRYVTMKYTIPAGSECGRSKFLYRALILLETFYSQRLTSENFAYFGFFFSRPFNHRERTDKNSSSDAPLKRF